MSDWIYWAKLYDTRFQARCLATRMEEDWWIYGYDSPAEVEVYQCKSGRYGVRYMWESRQNPTKSRFQK
ncbi:hypothetical protein C8J48_1919 [Desmospora activa DSM 45169]|uniref:Uncharacterized protein n=1 Tax=Desmospora activa DSM 45169 TaxID=1121389 RepID=A0A2T4ZBQ0_9BACL|nr:hypothetical protein C8J48_1919 [Desmospora activa DSM 45169]